jgi:hypothetical protein
MHKYTTRRPEIGPCLRDKNYVSNSRACIHGAPTSGEHINSKLVRNKKYIQHFRGISQRVRLGDLGVERMIKLKIPQFNLLCSNLRKCNFDLLSSYPNIF